MASNSIASHTNRGTGAREEIRPGHLPLLTLDENRIDLWFVPFENIQDEELLGRYRDLISASEQETMRGIRLANDRHRFLLTRATVRAVLSRYDETLPGEWIFTRNRFGKPAICPRARPANSLSFNLSHTCGAIVLAVAPSRSLGVDVENENIFRPLDPGNEDILAPHERAALGSLPASQRTRRFLELWTLKEAYLKARGEGFAVKSEHSGFDFPSSLTLVFRPHPALGERSDHWHFWQFRFAPDLLVAVCAERQGARPRIVLRGATPLLSEREFPDSLCARLRVEQWGACFTPSGGISARPDHML
jgi:4'-phosphopantetheinyl transferase